MFQRALFISLLHVQQDALTQYNVYGGLEGYRLRLYVFTTWHIKIPDIHNGEANIRVDSEPLSN
jgi:hypothetical protein